MPAVGVEYLCARVDVYLQQFKIIKISVQDTQKETWLINIKVT